MLFRVFGAVNVWYFVCLRLVCGVVVEAVYVCYLCVDGVVLLLRVCVVAYIRYVAVRRCAVVLLCMGGCLVVVSLCVGGVYCFVILWC